MNGIKITIFKSIRPSIPKSLLADGGAVADHNCDFACGELRNTRGGYQVQHGHAANPL